MKIGFTSLIRAIITRTPPDIVLTVSPSEFAAIRVALEFVAKEAPTDHEARAIALKASQDAERWERQVLLGKKHA